jgi:hypothetical protein
MSELTPEDKAWIDAASYETLLREWRFAPVNTGVFIGERGKYYSKVMFEKKLQCDWVAVSKKVGWKK